jgi:HSP20 family protein
MSSKALMKKGDLFPTIFDDFFGPWNEWFTNSGPRDRALTVPSTNIVEDKDSYKVFIAAPGLKKSDFNIDVECNMLTISSEKEENKEDKDTWFTRKEYNYSSFKRSFTLPDEIKRDNIEALYEDGVLKLVLPKKEDAKKGALARHIAVN